MRYQIVKEPMAILDIQLDKGESITAEAGCNGIHEGRY
jgi:uncharacterized protein (AIM24 family)